LLNVESGSLVDQVMMLKALVLGVVEA